MMKLAIVKKNYTNVIVIALLLLALTLMTVGFSYYHQTINFSGSAIVLGSGSVYISNVTVGNLRNATASPTYDDTTIDFNLYFNSTNAMNSTDYSASFDVTVTNESVYGYTWNIPVYSPTVYRNEQRAIL